MKLLVYFVLYSVYTALDYELRLRVILKKIIKFKYFVTSHEVTSLICVLSCLFVELLLMH